MHDRGADRRRQGRPDDGGPRVDRRGPGLLGDDERAEADERTADEPDPPSTSTRQRRAQRQQQHADADEREHAADLARDAVERARHRRSGTHPTDGRHAGLSEVTTTWYRPWTAPRPPGLTVPWASLWSVNPDWAGTVIGQNSACTTTFPSGPGPEAVRLASSSMPTTMAWSWVAAASSGTPLIANVPRAGRGDDPGKECRDGRRGEQGCGDHPQGSADGRRP